MSDSKYPNVVSGTSGRSNDTAVTLREGAYEFSCPHCAHSVSIAKDKLVNDLVRHAIFRGDRRQVDVVITDAYLNQIIRESLINGCGKLVRVDGKNMRAYTS